MRKYTTFLVCLVFTATAVFAATLPLGWSAPQVHLVKRAHGGPHGDDMDDMKMNDMKGKKNMPTGMPGMDDDMDGKPPASAIGDMKSAKPTKDDMSAKPTGIPGMDDDDMDGKPGKKPPTGAKVGIEAGLDDDKTMSKAAKPTGIPGMDDDMDGKPGKKGDDMTMSKAGKPTGIPGLDDDMAAKPDDKPDDMEKALKPTGMPGLDDDMAAKSDKKDDMSMTRAAKPTGIPGMDDDMDDKPGKKGGDMTMSKAGKPTGIPGLDDDMAAKPDDMEKALKPTDVPGDMDKAAKPTGALGDMEKALKPSDKPDDMDKAAKPTGVPGDMDKSAKPTGVPKPEGPKAFDAPTTPTVPKNAAPAEFDCKDAERFDKLLDLTNRATVLLEQQAQRKKESGSGGWKYGRNVRKLLKVIGRLSEVLRAKVSPGQNLDDAVKSLGGMPSITKPLPAKPSPTTPSDTPAVVGIDGSPADPSDIFQPVKSVVNAPERPPSESIPPAPIAAPTVAAADGDDSKPASSA